MEEEHFVGDYILGVSIGQGACAKVHLARHLPTGTQVVVKSIARHSDSREFREVRCMQSLKHPNIVSLLEVIVAPDTVHLVLEHVRGGDLREYLEQIGCLSEREARRLFRQVISAVQFCHQQGYAHRDIKPENILLEPDMTAKVADFGLSRQIPEDAMMSTYCGTLHYMAPEVVREEDYDGRKADVWALGASLHQAVTGRLPFEGKSYSRVRDRVLAGRYEPPWSLSPQCRRFLQSLLTPDPGQRPTLEEAMRMPWLNLGEEEALEPYVEPPRGGLDPELLGQMEALGFPEEQVRDSVSHGRYDPAMGTYGILRLRAEGMARGRMPGRTVRVRPYRPSDPGAAPPPSREASSPAARSASEAASLSLLRLWLSQTEAPPPSPEPSLPSLASVPALESVPLPGVRAGPAPRLDSRSSSSSSSSGSSGSSGGGGGGGGSSSSSSSSEGGKGVGGSGGSSSSSEGGKGVASSGGWDVEVSVSAGAAPRSAPQDDSAPASSAARTRGRPGWARRAFHKVLAFLCCGCTTCPGPRRRKRIHPSE